MSAKPLRESAIENGPPRVDVDLAAELVRRGRPVEVVTRGSSMWPLLRAGDRLRLEPAVAVRVGDLAAVRRDGYLLVHRVVRVDGGAVLLRGDNLAKPDAPVELADVIGVATRRWTRGGRCIDLTGRFSRLFGRSAAFLAARTRLPWRAARVAWLVVSLFRRAVRA